MAALCIQEFRQGRLQNRIEYYPTIFRKRAYGFGFEFEAADPLFGALLNDWTFSGMNVFSSSRKGSQGRT